MAFLQIKLFIAVKIVFYYRGLSLFFKRMFQVKIIGEQQPMILKRN